MNGLEIRKKIDKNNELIRKYLDTFVLSMEIQELYKENDKLREQCPHSFLMGKCVYCDKFEEK